MAVTFYLGPVGNLQALPMEGGPVDATLTVPTAVHQIAGLRGGRVVDRVGAAKRTYKLPGEWLTTESLAVLESLYLGAYGPGPYVLLDPWRQNLLTANQSSGTDVGRDTTGFVAITGTLTSSAAQADHGTRSLAWAVTAANQRMMQGSLANTTNATPALDTPVLPSTVYSFGNRMRLSASTGTARVDVYWFTAAGVFISASTGTATALSNSAFTTCLCLNVTSPATAALARFSVINTVMGAAQTLHQDKWQAALGAVLPAWAVGTGVPRVSFDGDLSQSYSIFPYVDAGLTMVEV